MYLRLFIAGLLTTLVACGGSDPILGEWRSESAQITLRFESDGRYFQWDTQFPAASLTQIDPSANPTGAKVYGTYLATDDQLSMKGHDGLYPSTTQAEVNASSPYSISGDRLTAPGLIGGTSDYLRAP